MKTIFELLNDVCYSKLPWREQSDADRKQFSTFMINRFLSMNPDYLEIVAETQKHTMNMDPGIAYEFYRDLLPKQKSYSKYISANADSSKKYDDIVKFISKKYNISEKESSENLELLFFCDKLDELKTYFKQHGYKDAELQSLFKEKATTGKRKKSR